MIWASEVLFFAGYLTAWLAVGLVHLMAMGLDAWRGRV